MGPAILVPIALAAVSAIGSAVPAILGNNEPPQTPAAPEPTNEAQLNASMQQQEAEKRRKIAAAHGTEDTILTSPGGLQESAGSTTSPTILGE